MIRGLAIGEYRSIGATQYIGGFGKINLFVGPNNSGKSNVLRFINDNLGHLTKALRSGSRPPIPTSTPHLVRGKPTSACLGVSASLSRLEELLKPQGPSMELLSAIHSRLNLDDLLWI